MLELNSSRRTIQTVFDGLLVAGLLALVFLLGCFRQKDADIWWHLKTGQMILDRSSLPEKDWFTFTSTQRDWIDLHWLFQITAAKLYSLGGMELLTLASASLGAAAVAVTITARRSGWSWPVAIACWFPVVFLLTGRMYVRPEVVTLVCFAAFLTVLFHANNRPRLVWSLVPVQILWVNVQGLFVLGIVLAGFYWVEGVWLRLCHRPESRLGLRTVLLTTLTAASLLNPYHIRGLLFPVELFRKMSWDADFYSKHISELQGVPQFIAQAGVWNFYIILHFAISALATASFLFIWSRRRFDLFRLLTFAAFAWLGLQATRNSGQFALVAGAVTAWNLGEWFAARRASRAGEEEKRRMEDGGWRMEDGGSRMEDRGSRIEDRGSRIEDRRSRIQAGTRSPRDPLSSILYPLSLRVALALILIGAGWSVVTGRFYSLAGEARQFGLGEHPLWHAHDAARFAARSGMPDRLIAFHLGHAAVFEFHKRDEQRTFCDPRLEVVSREVLEQYHAIEAAMAQDRPGWQAALGRHNLRMILTDHRGHFAIEASLLLNPDWRCVHFDPVAAVFVRDDVGSELEIAPVDFSAHSLSISADARAQPLRDHASETRYRVAEALYLVGRALTERTATDVKLARELLMRAARLAASSQVADERSFEHVRLLGQVSFSLSQLLPHEDDPTVQNLPTPLVDSPAEWLANAERSLREAISMRPNDFLSLTYLYMIAQIQHNVDEQLRLGERILSLRHPRPAERIIRDQISQELAELRREADPASREHRSPDPR